MEEQKKKPVDSVKRVEDGCEVEERRKGGDGRTGEVEGWRGGGPIKDSHLRKLIAFRFFSFFFLLSLKLISVFFTSFFLSFLFLLPFAVSCSSRSFPCSA